jgi:hypothetical protein
MRVVLCMYAYLHGRLQLMQERATNGEKWLQESTVRTDLASSSSYDRDKGRRHFRQVVKPFLPHIRMRPQKLLG